MDKTMEVMLKAFIKKAERGYGYFSGALDEFDYTEEQKEKFFAMSEKYIKDENLKIINFFYKSNEFFMENHISFNEVGIKYVIENLDINEANAKRLQDFISEMDSWYAYSYLVNNFKNILGEEKIEELRQEAEKKFNFFW